MNLALSEHPIFRYLSDDHARLDGYLARATAKADALDLDAFGLFRGGLLRHIGIEEKILFPAARRARGEEVPHFARLRADHGRLTALLVPTPTAAVVDEILRVLRPHNELEEACGCVYEQCIALTIDEAGELLEKIRSAREVPVRPYTDTRRPKVLADP